MALVITNSMGQGEYYCDDQIIFIADAYNNRVECYSQDENKRMTKIKYKWPYDSGKPSDVLMDNNMLYVSYVEGYITQYKIDFINKNIEFIKKWYYVNNRALSNPHSMILSNGLLYIVDSGNNRIAVLNCR